MADGVRLIVADDGKGFDPSSVADDHLGLAGMRTRAERIGARFECRSAPGQGTIVEILVEIDAIAVAEERPEGPMTTPAYFATSCDALLDSQPMIPKPPKRARQIRAGRPVAEPSVIRVLIVDDHAVVRSGLQMFFDLQDDIEVVGVAADGSEGVAMARRLEPDVVLMDLMMPNMDGITAIGRIKAERPETEIVTMTSFIEEEKVTAALEAGATGYVLKDAEADEVAAAVRAAMAGEVHLDPAVARVLTKRLAGAAIGRPGPRPKR